MYTTVGTYYSWIISNQDNRQSSKKNNKYQLCIHTVVPPDDGPRYARNMYRLTKYTMNKLYIKLVFLYTVASTTYPVASIGICKLSKTNVLIKSELHEDDVTKTFHKKAQLRLAGIPISER